MDPVVRTDRAGLAAPLTATLYEGRAARTQSPGDGLDYPWGTEYRDAAELQRICDALPGIPLTLGHTQANTLLSSGGTARIVGKVVGARVDGDTVVATMAITDPFAIRVINAGTQELSLGYQCHADENGYQRGTKLDHLALVPRARCGATCALRADAAETEECACTKADADLSAHARNALSEGEFAAPSTRSLPIPDAAHVRAAMSRFGQTHFADAAEKRSAYHKIIAKAHALGVETAGFEKAWSGRLDEHACKSCASGVNTLNMDPVTPNPAAKDNILMDELQKKLADALANAASEKARADQATTELTAAKTRADAAETAAKVAADQAAIDLAAAHKATETEKARADQAATDAAAAIEKSRADQAETLTTHVNARVLVLTAANRVLGTTDDKGVAIDRTAQTDRDIKVAVVKHVDGIEIATDAVAGYVDGMFDGAMRRHDKSAGSRADARQAIVQMRQDGVTTKTTGRAAEQAAAAAMRNRASSAWQNPSKTPE